MCDQNGALKCGIAEDTSSRERERESRRDERKCVIDGEEKMYCDLWILVNWSSMRIQANDSFCDAMTTIRDARSTFSNLPPVACWLCGETILEMKRANAQMNADARATEWEGWPGECEWSKMNRCLIARHVFNIVLLLLLLRYYVHRSLPHRSPTVPSQSSMCCG